MSDPKFDSRSANMLRRSFTPSTTTFIGREGELIALTKMLADPACRLLTLTGVGGIGKTQLAVQVLNRNKNRFADGAYLVDLQPIRSEDYLISAIADVIGAALSGREQLRQQLIHYLESKHQLLVLDNFEHLMEYADLLTEILQRAPGIKLLVTSREALNLQEEWQYPLAGLDLPDSHETSSVEQYAAVRLFVERARQVRPDFSLADERAGVIRICQLVEGMPLAIEMAAAWTKSLRCSAIAAEIQSNVQFLTSRSRNISQRHYSIHAVFTQTWERLTGDEQIVFKRLVIFRGGFQARAAQIIANASLSLLTSLVDKNLVRCDESGRYHLHELLRQFAESQLEPSEAREVAMKHCLYYADFVDQRQYGLVQGEQVETILEIETELENIRMAWQTAVQEQSIDAIEKMAAMWFHFGQLQARYLETIGALDQAVPILEAHDHQPLLAQIYVHMAWMLLRLGRLERASGILEYSREVFQKFDLIPVYGMGTHPLAPSIILEVVQGNYSEAVRLGDELVKEATRLNDQHMLAFAYYGLTSAYFNLDNYQQAYQCARQAVNLSDGFGNRWFKAYCLNELGSVARLLGNYSEAELYFRESYLIRQGFRDPEGIAVALTHLGDLALLRSDYAKADEFYQESLSIYQNLNDQGGLATVYYGLGQAAVQTGKIEQATRYLSEALEIATQIRFIPRMLSILIDTARLLMHFSHQSDTVIQLLTVIAQHPAVNQHQRKQIKELLGEEQQFIEGAPIPDLNTLIPDVQFALMSLTKSMRSPNQQTLIEPLSERELEVLQLLSRGMLNGEIAEKLVITLGTVKAHTNHIYGKLGVRNRVEAIARARELSLLNPE